MATSTPHILARTLKEAHDFAKSRGFERGRYRVINSSGTLKSVRNVDLFLVPGWERRYDRFQMKSAIRWTRMNIIDVAKLEEPAPVVDPFASVETITFDESMEITQAQAHEFFGLPADVDAVSDDIIPLVLSEGSTPDLPLAPDALEALNRLSTPLLAVPDDLQPPGEQIAIAIPDGGTPDDGTRTEKKPGRRRSRCKDCGDLHYKGDPCTPSESV